MGAFENDPVESVTRTPKSHDHPYMFVGVLTPMLRNTISFWYVL